MFVPGIAQIAEDLHCSTTAVIGTTTGYVVMLGIGPLILAPLSETFGRRKLYLSCFSIFALLQIPAALAPNIAFLITVRSVAGFFGSVGIANGGGTISDMFLPRERAGVFGWYLMGPLMGPTLGECCLLFFHAVLVAFVHLLILVRFRPIVRRPHCPTLGLAMDILDHDDHLYCEYDGWIHVPPRDIRADNP